MQSPKIKYIFTFACNFRIFAKPISNQLNTGKCLLIEQK